jgi:two-component system, chemotaxis family, CheB/CheR fusion protein
LSVSGLQRGGLEAFTQLLSHLPENTGMGFVLVQHLVPDQPSQLTSLFACTTKMPVREVKNDMAIRPDHTCGSLYRQTGKALFSVVGLGI